jgi:acetyltransferase-like isoleucine patch superfamily enzyme
MNTINAFKARHGLFLSVFRLPIRFLIRIFNRINTLRWRLFLKEVGSNVVIEMGVDFESPLLVSLKDNVTIQKGAFFRSELLSGEIIIGKNVQINSNVFIDHTGLINIGENSLISEGVKIYSHSHGYDPRSPPNPKPLNIENNVWIGSEAMVLENCSNIGENVIVAARSVVTKNVIKNTIVAGFSAKTIKSEINVT